MTTILAYLDPGSTSMIVSMLLGGLAAAGVAMRMYWHRVLRFLRIRKDDDKAPRKPAKPASAETAAQEPVTEAAADERQPVETTTKS